MDKKSAVFLDRDGTINEEVGYLDSLEKLRIFPETPAAIKLINESDMKVVIVTNQSGVARGYFDEELVNAVHFYIREYLRKVGAWIDAFYYCPHHATEGRGIYLKSCSCRKPKPGMLLRAAEDLDIDLAGSYMVGDTLKDIETAKNIPLKSVLVETGQYNIKKDGIITLSPIKPDHLAANILDAVNWIMMDRRR